MEDDKIYKYIEMVVTPFSGYQFSRFSHSPFWCVLRSFEGGLVSIGSGDTLLEAVKAAIKEEEDEDE